MDASGSTESLDYKRFAITGIWPLNPHAVDRHMGPTEQIQVGEEPNEN
jgi:hypothetical protein